ncbi:MAG: hypothetical protein IJF38_07675 [Clostridia bacterium]|nr:hypothetical protein [Clostridia bacterium]
MKRIRGFGYVGNDDVPDDEWEELDDIELEHGHASESCGSTVQTARYYCPRCNRELFQADVSLHGVIFIRCRRCRREVCIRTSPIMRVIGFIE